MRIDMAVRYLTHQQFEDCTVEGVVRLQSGPQTQCRIVANRAAGYRGDRMDGQIRRQHDEHSAAFSCTEPSAKRIIKVDNSASGIDTNARAGQAIIPPAGGGITLDQFQKCPSEGRPISWSRQRHQHSSLGPLSARRTERLRPEARKSWVSPLAHRSAGCAP